MDENTKEIRKRYRGWLIAMGLAGGLSGWMVQGMSDGFLLWALPLFCIGAAAFTLNGDSVIESLIVLVMLGGCAVIAWRTNGIVSRVGAGTIWGIYVALCVSKMGFVLGRAGCFGNKAFGGSEPGE